MARIPVTAFSTGSRARLRHAMRRPSPRNRIKNSRREVPERKAWECERDHLVLSGE